MIMLLSITLFLFNFIVDFIYILYLEFSFLIFLYAKLLANFLRQKVANIV